MKVPRNLAALSALTLALCVAACGGGAPARHVDRPGAAQRTGRAPGRGAYRWLVRTSGPQPTIAAENRNRGSTAWRLPDPSADVGGVAHGSVTGYVAAQAISPGRTERIYVSAPGARHVRITIFRMGWYGGTGGREVLVSRSLRVVGQPRCAHRFTTGLTECRWHPTLSFRIPSALPSGIYIAKLATRSGARDCLFVVLADRAQPLLAQLPTSTYEAYNSWGGDSLYPGSVDRVAATASTQGVAVSYDRPYDSITGAGEFFARDVAMVRFLERYGYPVSYTTSESVDEDPGQLRAHRALIDFGHSEYWSEREADAWRRALRAGTSLLFFGSDTLAWRVRFAKASAASSEAGRPDHTLVAYKEHAAIDPDRSTPTGIFPGRGAPLAGSAYLGCITPRMDEPGPPRYRYYAWAPALGLAPSWLFRHTGIGASTQIPGIVGYELDERTSLSPPGTHVVGYGAAPCMGAGRDEPGEPIPAPGGGLAETTIYRSRSGAIVFDTGTLGWELGLQPVPSASPDAPRAPDHRIVAMTRNLLAHVLRAR